MKLFYIQSPYYWRDLYKVSENLGIETYEILVDNPAWPAEEYDSVSKARKIRLWNEERYGSGAAPHNKRCITLGEGGDDSWILDEIEKNEGVYTKKIKDVLSAGDDVVLAVTADSIRMTEFFRSIQEEYHLRLHYIVWRDFPTRTDDETLLLPYMPYLKSASSAVICNSHGFCHPYVFSFGSEERNVNWEKETADCNDLFLDTARDYMKVIKERFEGNPVQAGDFLFYTFANGQVQMLRIADTEFRNQDDFEDGFVFESVTPGLNHDNCVLLKAYREKFAGEYGARLRSRMDEDHCKYKSACRGTCKWCDRCSEDLFRSSTLYDGFANHNLVKDNDLFAPINGIERMRIDLDGKGVRSLIMMDTCYLNCRYCINKARVNRFPLVHQISVMGLTYALLKDVPYFMESDGGVTFGGGEPLLYSEYIHQFHISVPKISINVETSLNVEQKAVEALIEDVDEWIIDIKDMNPEIYFKYTDAYNDQVTANLAYLLSHVNPEQIRCRVPYIHGFNTEDDVERSVMKLESMGIVRIERFEYK